MKTANENVFATTIQKTEDWLKEVQAELSTDNLQDAYRAIRGVLICLRDRITVEEATDLGAQLPMLLRGIYYEGWNPSKTPRKERSRQEFLDHVNEFLKDNPNIDAPQAVQAVFAVLQKRITAGEISDIRANLPTDLQEFWN